jgi:REP element-mobilizing transposase RayT
MLRGINRQKIFHDDDDKQRFLGTLEKYKEISQIRIYALCLMDNHLHLLVKEGNEDLAVTMKRIGVSYVWYYNQKYHSIGHLFQDRYRSEKVENHEYLLAAARYIHQNPVKAGIAGTSVEWVWSSCSTFYGISNSLRSLVDKDIVLDIFSERRQIAIQRFIEFNESISNDRFIDDDISIKLTDEEAKKNIINLVPNHEISEIKSLPKGQRNEIIQEIKKMEGVTQRQIARILGLSQTIISLA